MLPTVALARQIDAVLRVGLANEGLRSLLTETLIEACVLLPLGTLLRDLKRLVFREEHLRLVP